MGSCCRRPVRPTQVNANNFCSSLSLSTGVTLRLNGEKPEAVIFVNREGMSIPDLFTVYRCGVVHTAGVRLADLVARALAKAWGENPDGVSKLFNNQMPMLTAKTKLFELLTRCPSCNGVGCHACHNIGFTI